MTPSKACHPERSEEPGLSKSQIATSRMAPRVPSAPSPSVRPFSWALLSASAQQPAPQNQIPPPPPANVPQSNPVAPQPVTVPPKETPSLADQAHQEQQLSIAPPSLSAWSFPTRTIRSPLIAPAPPRPSTCITPRASKTSSATASYTSPCMTPSPSPSKTTSTSPSSAITSPSPKPTSFAPRPAARPSASIPALCKAPRAVSAVPRRRRRWLAAPALQPAPAALCIHPRPGCRHSFVRSLPHLQGIRRSQCRSGSQPVSGRHGDPQDQHHPGPGQLQPVLPPRHQHLRAIPRPAPHHQHPVLQHQS